jgi:hypothetical protein
MSTILRILKWLAIGLACLVVILLTFIFIRQGKTYEAPYPEIHASSDSTLIERGKYLVNGPAHCSGCHSPVANWPRIAAGEIVPLEGGFVFQLPIGNIHTPNITPHETGIGKLTDPEIARSLRYGVGFDGRALVDFMPFHNLSDEDLTAVISYLRVQPQVDKVVPRNEFNMLGKSIYAFVIEPVGPETGVPIPSKVKPDTTHVYGEYLANYVANCRGCHTNRDLKTGAYIGEYYSGGFTMPSSIQPGMACVTPNLTPDQETGVIADWTQEKFIQRFRAGRIVPSSEMPWEQFANFTDNDLKAIYSYLKSLDPINKKIDQIVVQLPS